MVDLHTHILPKIDDGSKSVEMSAAMLKEEFAQEVDVVALTSHYYGKHRSPEQFIRQREELLSKIREYIPNGMQVVLGAEVHFTGINMPDFDELAKLTLGDTKYMLIELPFVQRWTKGLLQALQDFISETGCTPIIAHVERYVEVWKKPALASTLVKMGCLLQVNTRSFLEGRSKKLSYALLKHGLVHCIGTDCHDMDGRAPNYQEAKETLIKAGYSAEWKSIQDNMKKVIAGEQVCVEDKKPVKKFFGKYL